MSAHLGAMDSNHADGVRLRVNRSWEGGQDPRLTRACQPNHRSGKRVNSHGVFRRFSPAKIRYVRAGLHSAKTIMDTDGPLFPGPGTCH